VSTAIDEARENIQQALVEIEAEKAKLERALKELGGTVKPKRRGRPAGGRSGASKATSASKPKRRRARKGGTRADHVVDLVTKEPGISTSDVATKLKVKPNYLYRVVGDLEKEGRVKKDGRKLYPA
jgi:hypothetical protein